MIRSTPQHEMTDLDKDIANALLHLTKPEDPNMHFGAYFADRLNGLSKRSRGIFLAEVMVLLCSYENGEEKDPKDTSVSYTISLSLYLSLN